ncbi:MAG: hypothetical protein AB1567_01925 [bacterium]
MSKFKEFAERTHKDPFCFVGHLIGYAMVGYGLWIHSWFLIILGFIICSLFCLPAILGFDTARLIKIWVDSYLNPIGLILNIIGWTLAIYGLWIHNWFYFIIAIVVMLIANFPRGLKK